MKKVIIGIFIFGLLGVVKVNAQIAIAVAKDENGSSVKWQIAWNNGYKTESAGDCISIRIF